jgi:hypothetical protein
MIAIITRFFDKLEDKVRSKLSHKSIFYALIGGVMVVLFWRGVWHTADIIMTKTPWMSGVSGFWGWFFYEPITIIWTSLVLLLTGLFVSSFIGDRIVISGIRNEKKITDKTEEEVQAEGEEIERLEKKVNMVMKEISEIKDELANK